MIKSLRSPGNLAAVAALTALSVLLAWISNRFTGFSGWTGFLAVLILAGGAVLFVLRLLRTESLPAWLRKLTIGAALLRLLAGALWFALLPIYGYETDVQAAGYIMEDAFQRDTAAWRLAKTAEPLTEAFRGGYRNADQYGGLLFFSAAIYRVFGGETAQPLLVVVFTAALSALAVPLGWAFSRRAFGNPEARWTAWLIALFPEAVLLGGSQMREAFIMPLAAAAFYGLAVYAGRGAPAEHRRGLAWLFTPLLLMAPLSPPFTVILVGLLGILGFVFFRWIFWRSRRFWVVLLGVGVLVMAVIWAAWPQIAPQLHAETYASPFELVGNWLRFAARWQAYLTERSSGWIQKIFNETPDWFNVPFLVIYGITRPLLPAQLVATSVPLWWVIGIWRSLGWTMMLAALIYAPVQALRSRENRALLVSLNLAVWAGVLYASFWGGGDQWDNPRYRVAFIGLQAALVGAAIVTQQRTRDPWLRRLGLVGGAVILWFIPWYLRRYTIFNDIFGWTVVDPFKLVGAGVLSGVLLVIWDMAAPPKPDA